MTVDVSKISASSYLVALEQLGPTKTASIGVGGVVLGANGNVVYSISVTAPVAKSIALGRIKFAGLTSPNPTDVGNWWYPVEGTFSEIVRGSGISDNFWLECYMSRNGTTYTCNFEIANNSATAAVTVPAFTLQLAADFYAYPF